jgi:hypothetical protein
MVPIPKPSDNSLVLIVIICNLRNQARKGAAWSNCGAMAWLQRRIWTFVWLAATDWHSCEGPQDKSVGYASRENQTGAGCEGKISEH